MLLLKSGGRLVREKLAHGVSVSAVVVSVRGDELELLGVREVLCLAW